LLRDQAALALAVRLCNEGVALGEAFSFMSGLYFRGKLSYAERFVQAANGMPKTLVITAGRSLMAPQTIIRAIDLAHFASVPIGHQVAAYFDPLSLDALELASMQSMQSSRGSRKSGSKSERERDLLAKHPGHRPPRFGGSVRSLSAQGEL